MSDSPKHEKLLFPRGPARLDAYASLYRFGEPSSAPCPALVYIGGVTSLATYRARMATEPVVVRDVVIDALRAVSLPRLNVLVCPYPADSRPDDEAEALGLEWFERHWDDDLEPALGARPSALGFIGYSAGASEAAHMAVVLEAAALASIGGAVVAETLREASIAPLIDDLFSRGWRLPTGLYRNAGDNGELPSEIAKLLPPAMVPHVGETRAGAHVFADYVANGVAAMAFAFVMEHLAR